MDYFNRQPGKKLHSRRKLVFKKIDKSKEGNANYPCPCCGYLVFTEPPGSYTICPICFWEDDISQLRFPLK